MFIDELKKYHLDLYLKYIDRIPTTKKRLNCPFPDHVDRDPSFRLCEKEGELLWFCSCGGGDIYAFMRKLKGYDFLQTLQELKSFNGTNPAKEYMDVEMEYNEPVIDHKFLYNRSTLTEDDIRIVLTYFNFQRRILTFTREDAINMGLKVNYYAGVKSILYPIVNIKGDIVQVGKIELDSFCKKTMVKIIGKFEGDRCFFIKGNSGTVWICEGIEDALTLKEIKNKQDAFIVTCSAFNFNKIGSFLSLFDKKYLLLDLDKNNVSIQQSECLQRHGVIRYISYMKDIKDANEALQQGKLQEWIDSLSVVEYKVKEIGYDESKDESKIELVKEEPIKTSRYNFDIECLPEKFKDFIVFCKDRIAAPDVLFVSAALSACSANAKHNLIVPEGDYSFFQDLFANFWFVNIAPSGSFKSTLIGLIFKESFRKDKELKKLKKESKYNTSLSKEQIRQIEQRVIDDSVLFASKITPEELIDQLTQGRAGCMILDEFGHWLKRVNTKSYLIDLKGIFTEIYSSPNYMVIATRKDGERYLEFPFLSFCGFTTKETIIENFKKDDFKDGFANRMLFIYPYIKEGKVYPPALPQPRIKFKDYFDSEAYKGFNEVIKSYSQYVKVFNLNDISEQYQRDSDEIYDYVYNHTIHGYEEYVYPFAKRWLPTLLKLTMIFQTFIDDSNILSKDALSTAKSFLYYCIDNTLRFISEDLFASEHQKKREKILKYIEKKGGEVKWSKIISSKQLDGGTIEYKYILENLIEAERIYISKGDWSIRRDLTFKLIKEE